MAIKHLVIPDTQVKPGVPLEHLSWCGEYIVEKRPDVIVQIGDFADMQSLSSYDAGKKSFEGRTYKADIQAVHVGMKLLLAPLGRLNAKLRSKHKPLYKPRMVLTLGNHEERITRAIELDRKLEGTIGLEDLGYEALGWEVYPYLQPVRIDGVSYSHFFPSGPMGRPCSSARAMLNKYHESCVAGHQQGWDTVNAYRTDGSRITTIIAGSFYQHNEQYLPAISNNHWRGVFMLHEVVNGSFDTMTVSLNYLAQKYGNDQLRRAA